MTAASVLEYIFITVTCCKEIAKKLFQHFLQTYLHMMSNFCAYFGICTHIIAKQIPPLSRTSCTSQDQTHFSGLSRSWKFYKHNSRTFQVWKPCCRYVK